MHISTKHPNQQTVEYRDFSGGLNTSNASEFIAQNELSRAINVEIDKSTGLLKTVQGTKTLYKRYEGADFTDMFYDKINDVFIICDADKKIYYWHEIKLSEAGILMYAFVYPHEELPEDGVTKDDVVPGYIYPHLTFPKNGVKEEDLIPAYVMEAEELHRVGECTGDIPPSFCLWEDGTLIASGGKLEYFHGKVMEVLDASPDNCNGVFVREGRVWTYSKDRMYCSSIGDERTWESDPNDQSSGQWIDIGYKDSGSIVGVVALSSDMLIIKDNGHVFRLSGSFPNWTVKEVSREVTCRGYRASIGILNSAVILGEGFLQAITTTEEYGDMQAKDISIKIRNEISMLPRTIKLRYVAPYNQIWIVDGDRRILFLELDNNAFFEREYTTVLKDVCYRKDEVYVLKRDKIQRLDRDSVFDEGYFLPWRWRAKTLVSQNAYLVKRARVDITPICDHHFECRFLIGKAELHGTHQNIATCGYEDYMPAYLDNRDAYALPPKVDYLTSDDAFMYNGYGYEDETPAYSLNMFRTDERFIERLKKIKVESWGRGGQLIFDGVNFEIAEV